LLDFYFFIFLLLYFDLNKELLYREDDSIYKKPWINVDADEIVPAEEE